MQPVYVEKAFWVAVIVAVCVLALQGAAKLVPPDICDQLAEPVMSCFARWARE